MKSRSDHLARIERALDRALASPRRRDTMGEVASNIITKGKDGSTLDCWDPRGLRALALAYANAAPPDILARLADIADEQHAWVEWWDRREDAIEKLMRTGLSAFEAERVVLEAERTAEVVS